MFVTENLTQQAGLALKSSLGIHKSLLPKIDHGQLLGKLFHIFLF